MFSLTAQIIADAIPPSAIIVPLLSAACSGGFVALVTQVFGKRKSEAETTEIVTKAAASVLGNYAEDNKRLRMQVAALERDNRELKRRYNMVAEKYHEVSEELREIKEAAKAAGLKFGEDSDG